jgi:hypothetical protein
MSKDHQLMQCYTDLLSSSDNKTVNTTLDCLKILLSHGEKLKAVPENPYVTELIAIDAIASI